MEEKRVISGGSNCTDTQLSNNSDRTEMCMQFFKKLNHLIVTIFYTGNLPVKFLVWNPPSLSLHTISHFDDTHTPFIIFNIDDMLQCSDEDDDDGALILLCVFFCSVVFFCCCCSFLLPNYRVRDKRHTERARERKRGKKNSGENSLCTQWIDVELFYEKGQNYTPYSEGLKMSKEALGCGG